MNEEELIEADYDSLSDSDILVLLMMNDDSPITATRLQKLALIYRELVKSNGN